MTSKITHKGGCHCGDVAFEVKAPAAIKVTRCSCSICEMAGYQHLIVAADDFNLLSGEHQLSLYTFNTGIAKHYFCKRCGIKSFYVPRSHPTGISVNARCIQPATVESVEYADFDGSKWEQNISELAPLPTPETGPGSE